VICDGDRGHIVLQCEVRQIVDPRCAIQQAVAGVNMEMYKWFGFHTGYRKRRSCKKKDKLRLLFGGILKRRRGAVLSGRKVALPGLPGDEGLDNVATKDNPYGTEMRPPVGRPDFST
jgi:hypothetical protein